MGCILYQVFLLYHIQHGKGGTASQVVSAEVVPSCPYTGVNIGLMSTPAIGKPLPMPFATVMMSALMPLY